MTNQFKIALQNRLQGYRIARNKKYAILYKNINKPVLSDFYKLLTKGK